MQKSISQLGTQLMLFLKEESTVIAEMQSTFALGAQIPEMSLWTVLQKYNVAIKPVFAQKDQQFSTLREEIAPKLLDPELALMDRLYTVQTTAQTNLEAIQNEFLALDIVESAYLKPASKPPFFNKLQHHAGSLRDLGNSTQLTTDLTDHQTYLDLAPGGIDAKISWTFPGGKGDGVTIIDIEGGWNLAHEDLLENSQGLLSGFNLTTDFDWCQHGTAVLGQMGGDSNNLGITGICPNASIGVISIFTDESKTNYNTAQAIVEAADRLQSGDILLIEQHRPGPNYPGGDTQIGYIAIEWWPCDYLAIRYATSKGIIVIEAAGNGSQDLNDASLTERPQDFPVWWSNPFNRTSPIDSGAILVGAGTPPLGTHGFNWGVDRSRMDFSNYGSCVDTQGWGAAVTTGGYGDIHGADVNNDKEWYTDFFAGTSSASPIIAGTVACLQGILRASGSQLIRPDQMRTLLRNTGSPQQAGVNAPLSQRIGSQPDLRQLISTLIA